MLIGYARVSTGEQTTDPQIAELRAAGCMDIRSETGSGGSRARPVLARLVREIQGGDTLVVVRIDRLARSLSHLLEVIEAVEARGAHFRSLHDPIDTASPQGKFTLQVLGAAAELERALIRERTLAGLASARAAGRVGGNPGLRRGDGAARRKIAQARDDGYFGKLEANAQEWVPLVQRHRPDMPWQDLVRIINARRQQGAPAWTVERLRRAVSRFVREGLLPKTVLERARTAATNDRLLAIVAAIKGADPEITLQGIGQRLEEMRERTPRGRDKWQPSSVKMLVDRAREQGLLGRD
ncbi:recombinase family protein [Paracoccus salipaludis]|uniref:DNA invertase n=1 Tax=Paracoccus salipaludis TaxID=2032623 RepID=A0A2A2GF83_9RHOB|nr:recombinase family protein [Paracoccus salipaludis]PAU95432.1 DNA invertase [Paracoccus salipaludis]